jgi:hypothetical protein
MEPYPIPLLNDLHRWFPDLLYNPTRFHDIQDVLAYVRQVADVNPYTRGLQQYIAQQNYRGPAPAPAPVPVQSSRSPATTGGWLGRSATATSAAPAPAPAPSAPAPAPAPAVRATRNSSPSVRSFGSSLSEWIRPARDVAETTYEYTATTNFNGAPVTARIRTIPISASMVEDEEEDIHAFADQAVTSILTQLLSPNHLQSFLEQNVEVAPTEQEIARASTLEQPTVALEDNCAICQDSMKEGEQLRRLNHCHHVFHKLCVDSWFRTNVHCPTCRHDIRNTATATSTHPPPPVPPNHRRTNIHEPVD